MLFSLTGVLMMAEIVARKGLDLPIVWAEDLTVFMFVWTTFLGAAVLYDRKQALVIDALVSRLPPRVRANVAIVVDVVVLAALVYLIVLTWRFLAIQHAMGHKLGGATGIPSYVLTASVLVCFVSFTGSTVASIAGSLAAPREPA